MTVEETPIETFRRCWIEDFDVNEDTLKKYPVLAFVYVLPKMNACPVEVQTWAEENVQSWMQVFRSHFRTSKGKFDTPIRRLRSCTADDDGESFEASQDPLYWRNLQPWSVRSYEWCLTRLVTLGKAELLACVLPPAIQLAEDHELEARVAGTRCLMHLVKIESALVVRMGLADLVLHILKVNLSFHESVDLLRCTFDCLELLVHSACTTPPLPGWRRPRYSPEYFDLLDEFMEVVLKDLALSKPDTENFDVLLDALKRIIIMEQLGSVRYLSSILTLIDELAKYTTTGTLFRLFETTKTVCAPRIRCYKDICTSIEKRLNI